MKTISLLVAAAVVGTAGLTAAPAFALSTTSAGNVPYCSTGNTTDFGDRKMALSQELQLSTKAGSTIEVWNGCLKVMYTGTDGHTTVAFYDPDSLRFLGTLGGTAAPEMAADIDG